MTPRTILATLVLTALSFGSPAQVNKPGTFHLSIGLAAGIHATQYTVTSTFLGIPYSSLEKGAALTTTVPIRFAVGVVKPLSIGLLVEPGAYLDSNATRTNNLLILAVEPRLYIVNTDRFAWTASGQFGFGTLKIREVSGNIRDAKYGGLNFGIGTGISVFFSERVGMEFNTRYIGTNVKLKSYSEDGSGFSLQNYDAELKTKGVTVQLGLAFKF